jgi:hypothetical protein
MRLTIALVLLVGCKGSFGVDKQEVEKTGAKLFEELTGAKPDSFTCPGDDRLKGTFTCVAKVGDLSVDVESEIKNEKGLFGDSTLYVQVKGHIFGKDVQAEMLKQYQAKVPVTEVTCPPIIKMVEGSTFRCKTTIEGKPYEIEAVLGKDSWSSRIVE